MRRRSETSASPSPCSTPTRRSRSSRGTCPRAAARSRKPSTRASPSSPPGSLLVARAALLDSDAEGANVPSRALAHRCLRGNAGAIALAAAASLPLAARRSAASGRAGVACCADRRLRPRGSALSAVVDALAATGALDEARRRLVEARFLGNAPTRRPTQPLARRSSRRCPNVRTMTHALAPSAADRRAVAAHDAGGRPCSNAPAMSPRPRLPAEARVAALFAFEAPSSHSTGSTPSGTGVPAPLRLADGMVGAAALRDVGGRRRAGLRARYPPSVAAGRRPHPALVVAFAAFACWSSG